RVNDRPAELVIGRRARMVAIGIVRATTSERNLWVYCATIKSDLPHGIRMPFRCKLRCIPSHREKVVIGEYYIQEKGMSTKDPNDGLTDQQRAAFDKYTEFCNKNFDKLAFQQQTQCSDHLATLKMMAQQKQIQQEMIQGFEIVRTRLEEV